MGFSPTPGKVRVLPTWAISTRVRRHVANRENSLARTRPRTTCSQLLIMTGEG